MKDARRQTLLVAFHATWIAGLVCIAISLYAIQLLVEPKISEEKAAPTLKLTFFTVPDPFEGIVGEYQSQAIQSWLQLSLHIQVILLGEHPSFENFTEGMPGRVLVDSDIDLGFSGMPMFNSIMARVLSSTSDISVLVDPQIVLTKDVMDTLEHCHRLPHSWLLVAMAKGIGTWPFKIDKHKGLWVNEDNQVAHDEQVNAYAKSHGSWEICSGRYLWAWSTDTTPLLVGVMPPFLYGFGYHHEWLLNEALSSSSRFVFDASDSISAYYLSELGKDRHDNPSRAFLMPGRAWGTEKNAHLAALYGSFYFRPTDFVNVPVKLITCRNRRRKIFQFLSPSFIVKLSNDKNVPFSNESGHIEMTHVWNQSLSWKQTYLTSFRRFTAQTRFSTLSCQAMDKTIRKGPRSFMRKLMPGKTNVHCNCPNITEGVLDCPSSRMKMTPKLLSGNAFSNSLRVTLKSLLEMVSASNETIVLSVVGYNYKDMLMNWVCRLRSLQITSFIVGAVDARLYEFALMQGLPVFMSGPSMDLSFDDCHFGTECFKKVTKLKSRMVLNVLKLGYRVLFSDVDVYWFKNPIKYLMSFGPKIIVAQSDQWNVTEAPNKPRRLNSGFYFVWPDDSTVAAFEMIVKHAFISNMSEQPSFYDVLCGEFGRFRLGDTLCLEPMTNVTTHFLDRELFPNGAFKDIWERRNVSETCMVQGCFVLHNNWVSGRRRKLSRQITSGLWEYDVRNRICIRSWNGQTTYST